VQLRRRRTCRTHELNLVEDPAAVVVQQAERDRPRKAALGVSAVQRAREEHVDRAHDDRATVDIQPPVGGLDPADQNMDRRVVVKSPQRIDRELRSLFDERPHR